MPLTEETVEQAAKTEWDAMQKSAINARVHLSSEDWPIFKVAFAKGAAWGIAKANE